MHLDATRRPEDGTAGGPTVGCGVHLETVTMTKGSNCGELLPDSSNVACPSCGATDRAIVRVADGTWTARHSWRAYRLSTGESLEDWVPALPIELSDRERLHLRDARAVPGTELLLLHWWHAKFPKRGGVFSLVNESGETVWSLARLEDSRIPDDEQAEYLLERWIDENGAILSVGHTSSARKGSGRQSLARHASAEKALGLYSKLGREDERDALALLPALPPIESEMAQLATSTEPVDSGICSASCLASQGGFDETSTDSTGSSTPSESPRSPIEALGVGGGGGNRTRVPEALLLPSVYVRSP